MLGQLFQSFQPARRGSSTRSINQQLDAALEENHTANLLFPEFGLASDHDGHLESTTIDTHRSMRTHGAFDLQFPRDIRVLVAQSGSLSSHEVLLFDSKPMVQVLPTEEHWSHSRASSRTENTLPNLQPTRSARTPTTVPSIPENSGHRRTASSYSAHSSSGAGVFQRGKTRRGSISSIQSLEDDLASFQFGREGDDIEKIALSCMFENTASSYKGQSTKVHIIPLANKPYDTSVFGSPLGETLGTSLGRPASLVRRPSALSQSHAPGDDVFDAANSTTMRNRSNRRTVLVTRTFSVTWTDEANVEEQKSPTTSRAPANFQSWQETNRVPRSQTFRSPMYAITLVLSLPIAPSPSPAVSRTSTLGRKSLRQMSMASSVESDRKGWAEATADMFSPVASDVDDRVDLIGRHWDIISRTLSSMQILIQEKLLKTLKPMSRIRRNPRLPQMAFAEDLDIKNLADESASRVIRGITITRVQTGHARWSAWQEEVQLLYTWTADRNDHFVSVFMSSFLGTHLDWLHSLAPKWYRKRYREIQRSQPSSDLSVPSRTVVISSNKMMARRIIFALSAFLPAHRQARGDSSPMRPGTSASHRGYSQSPPKTTLSRQASLRQSINRRGKGSGPRPALSRTLSIDTADEDELSASNALKRAKSTSESLKSPEKAHKSLVMPDGDPSLQKSSTIAAGITANVVLAPHFSRQHSFGQAPSYSHSHSHSRNSSTASANLIQPLQRSGSNASDSQWKTWGSLRTLLGGLGSRRGSTSEAADVSQTTDEGLGIAGLSSGKGTSKLEQMIDEIHGEGPHLDQEGSPEFPSTGPMGGSQTQSQPVDIPLKMTVNSKDGIIDVQIPFLDAGSPLSPSTLVDAHHHSGSSYGSSYGGSSFMPMSPKEPERPPNVSGWIDKVHADFSLQAVKPYPEVLVDVKAAMRAEPNPPSTGLLEHGSVEKWLRVCTSLVVDADSLSVKQITLSRLVRYTRQSSAAVMTPSLSGIPPTRSLYGNPYSSLQLSSLAPPGSSPTTLGHMSAVAAAAALTLEVTVEEKFKEEEVTEMDAEFGEAVIKALDLPSKVDQSEEAELAMDDESDWRKSKAISVNPRDTKDVIISSLERLAATVARERRIDEQAPEIQHSALRRNISTWMGDVEQRAAVLGSLHRGYPVLRFENPPPVRTSKRQSVDEGDQVVTPKASSFDRTTST
jgi:hypothetical protein